MRLSVQPMSLDLRMTFRESHGASGQCHNVFMRFAPLCDQLDLDGSLLVTNDPFVGLCYDGANFAHQSQLDFATILLLGRFSFLWHTSG